VYRMPFLQVLHRKEFMLILSLTKHDKHKTSVVLRGCVRVRVQEKQVTVLLQSHPRITRPSRPCKLKGVQISFNANKFRFFLRAKCFILFAWNAVDMIEKSKSFLIVFYTTLPPTLPHHVIRRNSSESV
jgi:hypothetical protein